MSCFAPLQHHRQQSPTTHGAPGPRARPCHCGSCDHALGNQAAQRLLASAQPKLKVSEPGDAAEHEADRGAGAAIDGPPVATSPARTAAPAAPSPVGTAFSSSGQPLDRTTRTDMEARLGQDFGAVRVHTTGEAAASSDALAAKAYTVGQDIVFAPGEYRPGETSGRRLLAHELVHTIQQRDGVTRLQRTVKPLAGRCVPDDEAEVLEDDSTRAGRAAHIQIQQFFAPALGNEVPLPRATKDKRGAGCPPPDREDGKIDLWQYGAGYAHIAEIKSVTGSMDAVPAVFHYIRRFYQLVGRMTGGTCAERTRDPVDTRFDAAYLGGDLAVGRRPEAMPLDSVVPMVKTWIGAFSLDPQKNLYCQLHPGGAVLYWCNKKNEEEDEDDAQALPAARALTQATEKAAQKSAERAATTKATEVVAEKTAQRAASSTATQVATTKASEKAAEKAAQTYATRKAAETATEKAAVKATERVSAKAALETTKKVTTTWAGRALGFLGPLAARANLWVSAAELTLFLAGGLAKYGYGSMYAGTRGYLLQQGLKRIADKSVALTEAAAFTVDQLYQLDLTANDEAKTATRRDQLFKALYAFRVALGQAVLALTRNGYSERYSAIDKHIDVRGQAYALAVSQLEVADGIIAGGDRSTDALQLLCEQLVDVTEWQVATVDRIFAARDAIVKEDISLWLAIKP